ncbi:hypothetical protein V3W47_14690 [Deinococcus sp. YIM 134068]|uniref:hypothetical protein n=1 Tax=Deinococcus lichenicola TaxID=3118910 RepID=UPI002F92547D
MSYQVTWHNTEETHATIRDILFMYVEMAESGGFFHNIDTGSFDALRFVDAELDVGPHHAPPVDLDLLRMGSAINLLCRLNDCWVEHDTIELPENDFFREAVRDGKFLHLPDIEVLLVETFSRSSSELEGWLDEQLRFIYERHVLAYFARLSRS